ncbi:MAG TPA: hypothetical protein DCQ26_11885 [Marinilabiliales bacterium]|nr:MAG: hypothetical protein A2W95_02180 [Bacteroidetes bacterium GWA2_40_14]OFZ25237.1 MAG: hypothetical protein A2437_07600 [Bacteroidetes bacterium RIFOXYC2_FULL_40_12]HAM99297.1 hypothetical protein [Marinilabiliales bacterium]HBY53502.1 hypothetical protein [Marinilabiliales bacterium]
MEIRRNWTDRFEELLKSQQVEYLRMEDILLREYGSIIIPLGPVIQEKPKYEVDARFVFKNLKGKLVWWSYQESKSGECQWYAVVKDKHTLLADYKSANTRNQIKKGLKSNEVRRIPLRFFLENGFPVYKKVMRSFNSTKKIEERDFVINHSGYQGFEDIIHFWGIFQQEVLIGYAIIYCYEKQEANISEVRIHPGFQKDYPSYALFHNLSEYYLGKGGFQYLSDGYRTLLHKTGVQELLIKKFHFHKEPLHLEVRFRPPFDVLVRFLRPFQQAPFIPSSLKAVLKLQTIYNQQKRLPK